MSLPPILMKPAYRHGAATPWGGARLRELYGKKTPDDRTGESLEVSALEGLNSTDDAGTPLASLIERYGSDLLGTEIRGEFPLLLKLLDAREQLSVQVHPGDVYARKHEGKSGKSEAWVILDARPGARLVYGVRCGITRDALWQASRNGRAMEDALRYINVQRGDVLYIPSGTIHAVGAEVVLYEIQQSSDVTYRFYDWERSDSHGNKRALQAEKALDVADLSLWLGKVVPREMPLKGEGHLEMLLDTPHFMTLRFKECRNVRL
ncbi:MAG: class I mannose-6-phosphate isomerase, partial [Eubacteriales bacterium]|nr:class I mannose-6-phosphate isomerase [Eubacteriales bacterium]